MDILKNENINNYISRCLNDKNIIKGYPDFDRRLEYVINKAVSSLNGVEAADFMFYFNELGNEEELTEHNIYIPKQSEYIHIEGEIYEEVDLSIAKPGLWDNIRKKKQREGKNYKPAKPGDKDRPDPEAWKKAQSNDSAMAVEQIQKMHDQLMAIVKKIESMDVEFEEWTKDMISKAEIYIQNVYDFVSYYEPGKYEEEDESEASEYQGRKVTLNKPFRTPDGPKKFSVYVKNDKGNIVKVNFGDPNMKIKKNIPERRKSFRARHHCDTNPGPRYKARYWACKAW